MNNQDTSKKRKQRFNRMTSSERKELLRAKMKAQGLVEGSGVAGVTYEEDEILNLILITSCLPELQKK